MKRRRIHSSSLVDVRNWIVSIITATYLRCRWTLSCGAQPVLPMICPTCACPLELASLEFKWLGREIEASATHTCPKCSQTYIKIGNRLTRISPREITLDQ
ncbi:MAG: hypothetical protein ABSC50_07575 [Candidatus Bathyarchaeia archaeon]